MPCSRFVHASKDMSRHNASALRVSNMFIDSVSHSLAYSPTYSHSPTHLDKLCVCGDVTLSVHAAHAVRIHAEVESLPRPIAHAINIRDYILVCTYITP